MMPADVDFYKNLKPFEPSQIGIDLRAQPSCQWGIQYMVQCLDDLQLHVDLLRDLLFWSVETYARRTWPSPGLARTLASGVASGSSPQKGRPRSRRVRSGWCGSEDCADAGRPNRRADNMKRSSQLRELITCNGCTCMVPAPRHKSGPKREQATPPVNSGGHWSKRRNSISRYDIAPKSLRRTSAKIPYPRLNILILLMSIECDICVNMFN